MTLVADAKSRLPMSQFLRPGDPVEAETQPDGSVLLVKLRRPIEEAPLAKVVRRRGVPLVQATPTMDTARALREARDSDDGRLR